MTQKPPATLDRLWDSIPAGNAPIDDLLSAGRVVKRRQRRTVMVGAATVAALLVGGGVVTQTTLSRDSGTRYLAEPMVIGEGTLLQLFSTTSAADWVKNADFVAVVTVTEERERRLAPDAENQFTSRTVRMAVDRVLWTRADPAQPIPAVVDLEAFGWEAEPQGLRPLAIKGVPRLEVGRTYVIAFVWRPRACSEGDGAVQAGWMTMGQDATLPVQDGKVGYGESEGNQVHGDTDQARPGTLEYKTLGESVEVLRERLASAPANDRDDVFPVPTC